MIFKYDYYLESYANKRSNYLITACRASRVSHSTKGLERKSKFGGKECNRGIHVGRLCKVSGDIYLTL